MTGNPMKKTELLAALLLPLIFGFARTAFAVGTTSADFLKLGVGARNIAMGETGATESSVYAAYWNPAGLAQVDGREFAFTYGAWLANISYRYAAYAQRTAWGTFAASWDYVFVPDIQRYDNTGAAQNSFYAPVDSAFGLSYANTFSGVPVGATVKYLYSQLDDASARTLAADVGVLLSPLLWERKDLALGLAVQNIGSGMKFISETDPLPLNVKLGASYRAAPRLTLAADADKPKDESAILHLGAEYTALGSAGSGVSLRAGYETNRQGVGGIAGATFGLGIDYARFSFDYALTPFDDLGLTHRASVKVRF